VLNIKMNRERYKLVFHSFLNVFQEVRQLQKLQ